MKSELCEDCVAQLLDYFGGEIPKDFPVCIHCHHAGDREEMVEKERFEGWVYPFSFTQRVFCFKRSPGLYGGERATLIVWKEVEEVKVKSTDVCGTQEEKGERPVKGGGRMP
jgi:hypothetical protein